MRSGLHRVRIGVKPGQVGLSVPLYTPAGITERVDEAGLDAIAEPYEMGSSGRFPTGTCEQRRADREVLAAVHVHGPSYRFPASGTRERVTERVVRAADRISEDLREGTRPAAR